MYSWIASWITGTTEEQDQSLYVKNEKEKPADWTWIEVIEENHSDGIIFIQSSEAERQNKFQKISDECKTIKEKRRNRREIWAERTFRRSLYIDFSLSVQPPATTRLMPLKSMPVKLQTLCKRTLSISEILSNTFRNNTGKNLPEAPEVDVAKLMQQALLLQTLLEIVTRTKSEKSALDSGLEQWLFEITRRKRDQLKIQWNERKAIAWKQTPAIEWKRNQHIYADNVKHCDDDSKDDEVHIVEVRYYLPTWLKEINVFEECENLPNWMKKIDLSLFEENTERKSSRKIPTWMQQIDFAETNNAHKAMEKGKPPSWMQRMNLSTTESTVYHILPSWLKMIDVCEEPKCNLNREKMKDWVKKLDRFKEETPYHGLDQSLWKNFNLPRIELPAKNWLRKLTIPQDWYSVRPFLTKVNEICESLMGVAVLVATSDVCSNAPKHLLPLTKESRPSPIQKRKRKNNTVVYDEINKKRRKTNKKWLSLTNAAVRCHTTKRKRQPNVFSGRSGMRAC